MRSFVIIVFAILCQYTWSQADNKYIRKGNGNYRDSNYQQAEVEYRKALEENPSSQKADFNLGNSLYKQKQYDAAAGKYSSLIEQSHASSGHTEQSRSMTGESLTPAGHSRSATISNYYYNLGNTLFQGQKFRESIEAYKNALRNNPADPDAKHNLQLALKMMKEQEQQQNKDQQNNNDSNDEEQKQQQQQDKKDQQNKEEQNKDQQNNQNQDDANDQQQPEHRKAEITPEDAERILQALEHEEKETMKEVQERKENSRKVPVEKNW